MDNKRDQTPLDGNLPPYLFGGGGGGGVYGQPRAVDETLLAAFQNLNMGGGGRSINNYQLPIGDYGHHHNFNGGGDLGFLLNNNGVNVNPYNYNALLRSYIDVQGSNQDLFFPYATAPIPNGAVFPSPNSNFVLRNQQNLRKQPNNPYNWVEQPTLDAYSVEELRNNIVALSKDQQGCKILQKRMDAMTRNEIDMIFSEVIECVGDLMLDPFGNYVVQKLIELCTEEQMTRIVAMLTRTEFYLVRICFSMHGTRSVQKLLDTLSSPQQISMVMRAIRPGAVALSKDMNGHHVIQHCLKKFSVEDNMYLLSEVVSKSFMIATDKSGCCVLQHCMESAQGELKQRLLAEIISNALLLAENPYGNYVVQHLFELGMPEIEAALVEYLEGSFAALSCNKYGSNVVEKCLKALGQQRCMQVIMELMSSPSFSRLLLDPFGNYVIQCALTESKGGLVHNALVNMVQKHASMMRSNIFGKKVLAWFDKKKPRNN